MGLFDNVKRKKQEKEIDKHIEDAKRQLNSGSLVRMFLTLKEIPKDNSYRRDEIRRLQKLCDEKIHQQVQENEKAKAERADAKAAVTEKTEAAEEVVVEQHQPEAEPKPAEDTPKTTEKSLDQWEKEAQAGDADAMMECYRIYIDKNNPQADTEKAVFWLGKAFEQEQPEALFETSKLTLRTVDSKEIVLKAYELLERLADGGMTGAMSLIMHEYALGNEKAGIAPDMKKALYWEEKLAHATKDEKVLLHLYEQYTGDYFDTDKAAYWIAKSLENGYGEPAFRMSLQMFESGAEDAEFYEMSLNLMKAAADIGHQQAVGLIGEIYAQCINAELNKGDSADSEKLKKWINAYVQSQSFEERDRQDKAHNLNSMGKILIIHDQKKEGLEYLARRAEYGNEQARKLLIEIYSNEKFDYYNVDKALHWSTQAANAGDGMECMRCAMLYMGIGKQQMEEYDPMYFDTLERIYYWLDKAMEYGDEEVRKMAKNTRQGLEEIFEV